MQGVEKKVGLFIVGQPKSGTTALAHHLSLHPQICMSIIKEPNYFASDFLAESAEFHGGRGAFPVHTLDEYHALFSHATKGQVLAEASTAYLYSKTAAANIKQYNPDAKIVIFLREPVALMHSLHMQYVNEANEDEGSFEQALAKEPLRKRGQNIPKKTRCPSYLHYTERIKYAEQLKRYYDLFPSEHILLFTLDEYKHDNPKVYRKVLELIDVDAYFTPEFKRVHDSKTPRSQIFNKIARHDSLKAFLRKHLGNEHYVTAQRHAEKILLKKQPRPPLPIELERRLKATYRHEVETLSTFLSRDLLSEWDYQ